MNEIAITNITQKDRERKQIRILAHQKELFPTERPGFPQTYDITVIWEDDPYSCTYRIGSKDSKTRSGVLRIKDELAESLDSPFRRNLILKRIGKNEYHLTSTSL
jgi:hypothetical protein